MVTVHTEIDLEWSADQIVQPSPPHRANIKTRTKKTVNCLKQLASES